MTALLATLAVALSPGLPPAAFGDIRDDRHHAHAVDPRVEVVRPYRAKLTRIAWCESTNNPRAVSPGGQYFGLLQFDLQTWASVGGHGYPHRASRLEQLYRGALLYRRRGPAPWPICGYR